MAVPGSENAFSRGALVIALATFFYVYLIFPSLIIVPISFGNRVELVFPPKNYSLDLYRDFFGSPDWLTVTYRSGRNALLSACLALLAGVPGAYALARVSFPGKQLLVTLILSPILVPIVVISLGLYLYYLEISLAGTVAGLVLAHAMYVTPFVVITMAAGISQLDERLETAATIMGASRSRVFWDVVLPQLTPSLISASLFAFLMSFDEVVIAWFITGPGTVTLPVKMYSSIKWESSPVLAAVATILIVVSMVVCLAAVTLTRGRTVPK
ncbi:MAG TPA: ABC transporter permease [Pseudolabrys sp.]|nr:ABC transporter permease [Pseudolabrys sp.]